VSAGGGSAAAPSANGGRLTAQRLRERLRAPRRLRVLRPGGFLIAGTIVLGLATLNTGNNLLYLMLGALLGTIALSGWLSERALRGIHVERVLPHRISAGASARIEYRVHNASEDPVYALRILDLLDRRVVAPADGSLRLTAGTAIVTHVPAQGAVRAWGELMALRRGEYDFDRISIGTSFPFGLFFKERDVRAPATLLVWPRTDREVRPPRGGAARGVRLAEHATAAPGAERGDFRGLRDYRPGDDPRDLHWRTTARRARPVVREYDRRTADEYWIVLDTVAADAETGEVVIETAAALLVAGAARGHRIGFAAGGVQLSPAGGRSRIEAALDMLASIRVASAGPVVTAPAPHAQCVLVTARETGAPWADIYDVREADR
jgi:uncharacterized protein (DUF58 family)